MFSAIVPDDIKIKRVNIPDVHISEIHPEEREIAQIFTNDKRKKAFIAGRLAAKEAQIALGKVAEPVGRTKERQPTWPTGIIGTITHTKSEAYAAVSTTNKYTTLGLDVEELKDKSSYDISGRISCDSEYAWIHQNEEEIPLRTLMMFTAKEAIYKAIYPHYKKVFGFSSAILSWDDKSKSFNAKLQLQGLPDKLAYHQIHSAIKKPYVGALTYLAK